MTATGFLLDTNVLSELSRKQPAPAVLNFLASIDEEQFFISAVTLAELERGIHLTALQDPAKAAQLRAWLERQIVSQNTGQILPFDTDVARVWGMLLGTEAARKQPRPLMDSLIAATAYAHRLTLVTRNTADFLAFPIAVLNPWEHP